eukprot:TRINITY_DN1722_c0_g1_i1.p1 TRINITY_DN1722_c0_g1~~TRINITY_DN1722_c0_g1_i1.p1  ORF type:complete len:259 (-),score=57.79 TRINITY_DN1722_c0_g1_i1:514-1290(-)
MGDYWNVTGPSSRNWDLGVDEEDEIEYEPSLPTVLNMKDEESISCATLVISCGKTASIFLHSIYDKKTEIGTVECPYISAKKKGGFISIHDNSCSIYSVNDDSGTIVVTCHYDLPSQHSFSWTKTLFSGVAPERVIIFSSYLDTIFYEKSSYVVEPPALRKLNTSSWEGSDNIEHLESPLVVEQLQAAILSHCELRSIPAILILSVEDERMLEMETIEIFETCLEGINLAIPQPVENCRDNYSTYINQLPRKYNFLYM